ncbi:hypothetical protein CS022_20810 [Veronia nyctiphanis]|uniref:Transcription factor zinc-finger domain-containing protein n=1 Tax=Veronia nyctiphanis TaxID=1278244 RepID=A0A4Q0YQX9_9GAMM|nr:zf-TFIIB domain-containing protein [Veronia nyctiphanis]RXJ71529.1 hypothetical protein CS022_20810 [Veronia nyctiphanis]
MKCTNCGNGKLEPSFLEGQFRAHTCSSCAGNWILIEDFVAWKERNQDYQFADDIQFDTEISDTKKALLCPVSGSIMRKFKISAHNAHRVDYSNMVGGIWLDEGEWELLKSEGLAGSLNALVTSEWQKTIRSQSAKDHFSDIYSDRFGREAYEQAQSVRQWLQNHPQKADLRAYLMAEDPYSAEK